ncbi:hypothetical protein E4T56_gene474 [Termitomyces sp. T112]|nr:hypothetical protein E4T56_gene474 [Termitomyces sp. T112]
MKATSPAQCSCHDLLPGPLTLFPAHLLPWSHSPNASPNPPTIVHPPCPPQVTLTLLPLANSDAFSAAVDASSKPLEPSPTIPDTVYVPCHWTPDPNQVFYTPSISQGIPLGWCCPPAFPADGNYPCTYSGGFSAALPNSAYLLPAHYYVYSVPTAAPAPPEHPDNYSPP